MSERDPKTNFGKCLVRGADSLNALAEKETPFNERGLLVIGGVIITTLAYHVATKGSDLFLPTNDIVYHLLEQLNYKGDISGHGLEMRFLKTDLYPDGVISTRGNALDMPFTDLARALINGEFKDASGKPVFLLDSNTTAFIRQQLERLTDFKFLGMSQGELATCLGTIGVSSILNGIFLERGSEKLKCSAPVGRIPAILPTLANMTRKVGNFF